VSVEIDSLGKITSIDFGGYGIFSSSVKSTIRNIKWIPESYNGRNRSSEVVFDVQFQIREKMKFPKRRVIQVESSNPAVRKN